MAKQRANFRKGRSGGAQNDVVSETDRIRKQQEKEKLMQKLKQQDMLARKRRQQERM